MFLLFCFLLYTAHSSYFHSIIREIKRIGGLDTVGIECGSAIMRRVKVETQLSIGVARAHEITDDVAVKVNDADQPWWTAISSFENSREQLERVREFITFSRYCPHDMPVFVGHSLFFKAFYSKRISTMLAKKRPNLSANLKKYRLSNASLLVVTVKYLDLESGSSDALILDADLLFGGGFHGAKHAHGAEGGDNAAAEAEGGIDGSLQLPPPPSALQSTTEALSLQKNLKSSSRALSRRMSLMSSSISGFLK